VRKRHNINNKKTVILLTSYLRRKYW